MPKIKYYAGLSFIELILSLGVSMLLFSIFSSLLLFICKEHHRQIMLTANENDLVSAQAILTEHLHMAGYLGCTHYTPDFPLLNHSGSTIALPILVTTRKIAQRDTDVLTLWHAKAAVAFVTMPMTNRYSINIFAAKKLKKNSIYLINNCIYAAIVTLNFATANKLVLKKPLTYLFKPFTEIMPFEQVQFFIDDTKRKNAQGKPIFALYSKKINESKIELISGVINMQITFDILEHQQIMHVHYLNPYFVNKVIGVLIKLTFSRKNRLEYIYVALRENTPH